MLVTLLPFLFVVEFSTNGSCSNCIIERFGLQIHLRLLTMEDWGFTWVHVFSLPVQPRPRLFYPYPPEWDDGWVSSDEDLGGAGARAEEQAVTVQYCSVLVQLLCTVSHTRTRDTWPAQEARH